MTARALPVPLPLPLDALGLAPDADAGCGALATERGNLPLESIDVRAAITGLTARVVLGQTFRNPHAVPIEATYVFPLPDRAAVTGMRMEAADRAVDAVLKERGEARAEYQQAIGEGKRASIAEEERPDVFTMRVGNVLPGETVVIRLTLDQPLPWSDGEATFRFPLVVAPRYVPGEPLPGEQAGPGHVRDTTAAPDASRISPPVLLPGFPNPVALSISVDVDPGGLPLGDVRSSLHTVVAEGSTYRVQPGERVDRDFVLRLAYGLGDAPADALVLARDPLRPVDGADGPAVEGAVEGAAQVAAGAAAAPAAPAEGTFQLTVLPPTAAASPRPRDVVVLLDRSGSMHGWKMVAARRAAARIVDTLTDRDRFAVLAFDSVVERPPALPSGLVPATDRHRFRAVEHLATMHARGGTELLAPLTEAVALLSDAERDRVLVLVTDGQVGNEDQIVTTIQPGLAGVRVHTVGIDRAVNAGFLTRLAILGGGRCELVESEEGLDEAADHIHRRIGTPLVTDLRVHAGDGENAGAGSGDMGATSGFAIADGSIAPARLPSLVPGVPLVIAGRWRGSAPAAVTVTGVAADGSPWRVVARATGTVDAPAVGAVWARAHLRDLEDAYLTADPGRLGETERRIVATSLRHGVLCRFTAYVAVDSRVVTDGSAPHEVLQPVEQPSGWEMRSGLPPAMPMSARARAAGGAVPRPGGLNAMADGAAFAASAGVGSPAPAGGPVPPVPPAAPMAPAPGARGGRFLAKRAPAREHATAGDPLTWVREQAVRELELLRSATGSPHERWITLADLASRLRAVAVALTAPGMPPTGVTTDVAAVAEAVLTGTPAQLDELWRRTVAVLERLAVAGSTGSVPLIPQPAPLPVPPHPGPPLPVPPHGPEPVDAAPRRRLFWKR